MQQISSQVKLKKKQNELVLSKETEEKGDKAEGKKKKQPLSHRTGQTNSSFSIAY